MLTGEDGMWRAILAWSVVFILLTNLVALLSPLGLIGYVGLATWAGKIGAAPSLLGGRWSLCRNQMVSRAIRGPSGAASRSSELRYISRQWPGRPLTMGRPEWRWNA